MLSVDVHQFWFKALAHTCSSMWSTTRPLWTQGHLCGAQYLLLVLLLGWLSCSPQGFYPWLSGMPWQQEEFRIVRLAFIVVFSWKNLFFVQYILFLVSPPLISPRSIPPPSPHNSIPFFLSLQSKQTEKKYQTQGTHTHKVHKNTILETIIYKQKSTKTKNAQIK